MSVSGDWRPATDRIEPHLKVADALQHGIKGWRVPEDHAGHRRIVAPQIGNHGSSRRQGKCAGAGSCQTKIGAVEKHPGMADAIAPKFGIGQRSFARAGCEQLIHVIIMAGDPLAAAAQHAAPVKPVS